MRPETQTKAELRDERDHWRKLAEEGLEPRIQSMRFEGGNFDAQLTGQLVEQIAIAFVSHFKSIGAKNYMELNIHDRDEPYQRYIVTVQKVGALSPADKVRVLQQGIIEAEQWIAKISGGGETDIRAKLNGILSQTTVELQAKPMPSASPINPEEEKTR